MTRLLIDPAATAAALVADYAKTDPIADHETENGMVAGLQSDNCDIDVSESVYFPIPSDLPTLSPDEIAEGDARQEHC